MKKRWHVLLVVSLLADLSTSLLWKAAQRAGVAIPNAACVILFVLQQAALLYMLLWLFLRLRSHRRA